MRPHASMTRASANFAFALAVIASTILGCVAVFPYPVPITPALTNLNTQPSGSSLAFDRDKNLYFASYYPLIPGYYSWTSFNDVHTGIAAALSNYQLVAALPAECNVVFEHAGSVYCFSPTTKMVYQIG